VGESLTRAFKTSLDTIESKHAW